MKYNNTIRVTFKNKGLSGKGFLKSSNLKGNDYYSERAVYLYTDNTNFNEIRLIHQQKFDSIKKKYPVELFDKEKSHMNLMRELELNSQVMINRVGSNEFYLMLKNSNLKKPIYDPQEEKGYFIREEYRLEQAAILYFDTKKLEIRIEHQDDSKNTEDYSRLLDSAISPIDGKAIRWGKTESGKHEKDEGIMIIGTVHTHPFHANENVEKFTETWFQDSVDGKRAREWGVPFFQIYPESIDQVDVMMPAKGLQPIHSGHIDSVSTTRSLLSGDFDLARKSLELNGGKNNKD